MNMSWNCNASPSIPIWTSLVALPAQDLIKCQMSTLSFYFAKSGCCDAFTLSFKDLLVQEEIEQVLSV